jgi:hypothetical protein
MVFGVLLFLVHFFFSSLVSPGLSLGLCVVCLLCLLEELYSKFLLICLFCGLFLFVFVCLFV